MFIAFEGVEGSGKTLQIKLLGEKLKREGINFVITKEPGSTYIGSKIREILLSIKSANISFMCELFLYFADRAQHYTEVIRPNFGKRLIVSDRSMYSTFAYQGYGRGIDMDLLAKLNDIVCEKVYPEPVILLDCDVDVAVKRALKRDKGKDFSRFELEDIEFHRRVRKGYLELAEREGWFVVDASRDPELVHKDIVNFLWTNYGKVIENFAKK